MTKVKNIVTIERFLVGPYSIEEYPIGYCVVNANGFNVLSFEHGGKFTNKKNAQEICDKLNKEVD